MNYLSINSIYKEIKWRLLFKKLRKIEFLILDVDGVLRDFIPCLIDDIKITHPQYADKILTPSFTNSRSS